MSAARGISGSAPGLALGSPTSSRRKIVKEAALKVIHSGGPPRAVQPGRLPSDQPVTVERLSCAQGNNTHAPLRQLSDPTTLIIGDSITRDIRLQNIVTRCFPGATVPRNSSPHCSLQVLTDPVLIQTILSTRPARSLRTTGANPLNLKAIAPSDQKIPCDIIVKMALFNAWSLSNKTFILNEIVSSTNLDFLLLTETWLCPDEHSQLIERCPPEYKFITCPRLCGRGGGPAVVFKNIFNCCPVNLGTFSTFETLAFKIVRVQS